MAAILKYMSVAVVGFSLALKPIADAISLASGLSGKFAIFPRRQG